MERTPEIIAEIPTLGGKPKLPDRVREAIRVKHYSIRTEEVYCSWIRRFILFSGKRHPRELGGEEVACFLYPLVPKPCLGTSLSLELCSIFAHSSCGFVKQLADETEFRRSIVFSNWCLGMREADF